ncbi:stressosome-associated protein Prli42 [Paenibacillus mesotrionivorans]|uniref:Stressosome-associated protein Prli42 n=1 Tax=Paenibacillus mesotrionivorans TaxID=3160968 RepID=A0ACC7NZZ1_9BACL
MSGTAPDVHPLFHSRFVTRPYTFSLKELIVLINKRVMRVVVWLMIAAMLFSTVMYLVAAFTGI